MNGTQPSRDELRPARRTVLAAVGTATAVGLAGCLGGGDDTGGDDENGENDENGASGDDHPDDPETAFELAGDGGDSFRQWVIPDNPIESGDSLEHIIRYEDFNVAAEQNWESLVAIRDQLGYDVLGVDPETIAGELLVGDPEGDRSLQVILGSFDVDTVVAFFEEGDRVVDGEYGDYTVFEPSGDQYEVAVGPDAIVATPLYERYIDAHAGEADRLEDTDEDVSLLFDLLPRGLQTSVYRRPDMAEVAVMGDTDVEINHDDDQLRAVRTFVYESEDDASLDHATETVSNTVGEENVLDGEHDGRVAMVEYLIDL